MKEGAWDLLTAQIWASALTDLGMTKNEFYVCLRKSLSLEWLPTIPYDFYALADSSYHFPDVRYAYEWAVEAAGKIGEKNFPHIAIYETYSRIGSYALTSESEATLWKKFQSVYNKVCNEIKQGAVFQLPSEPQLEYIPVPATKEQAMSYLEEANKIIALANLKETTNPLVE